MTGLGGEDPQLRQDVVLGKRDGRVLGGEYAGLFAGEQQGLEVGLAAATGEDPVGVLAEADALRRPVDEAALDEGAAGALVPGVEGGVDGGEDRFAEQRRDHDRAVEVGEVAGVVEVDGVAQVDAFELVQGGCRVGERALQVDRGDPRGQGGRGDAAEGPLGSGDPGRHPLDARGQGVPVAVHRAVVEQVGSRVPRPGCGRDRGCRLSLETHVCPSCREHLIIVI